MCNSQEPSASYLQVCCLPFHLSAACALRASDGTAQDFLEASGEGS